MSKEYIDFGTIENVIDALDKDNQNIKDLISDINNNFKKIDKDIWNSPERDKFDNEFIPYLNSKEININDNLKKSLDELIKAKDSYKRVDRELTDLAETLNE